METFVKKSGDTGLDALNYVRQQNVLNIPYGDKILCFDDSDRLHELNLVHYRYAYAGDVQSYAPSVAARPNDGLVKISEYSYLYG